ncbi:hypothetical protein KsCSTR_06930 [Candidatus Kuenenia stuttgartiensis]|uniref:Uncharacterized protein n=1 Tax=Kuenenia stuttgartiensis TaxID=174633 RepID=Q1PZP1_KUEST|nr:hypothetical protein KsCSTR_06930 [Candidatus Kuenenia stuttgartiensis]CAJ72550.1 unknown protein [Candidatus Kuenenia stuttgartiensis]
MLYLILYSCHCRYFVILMQKVNGKNGLFFVITIKKKQYRWKFFRNKIYTANKQRVVYSL